MTIAAATKVARRLATGAFGYDQSQRWSGLGDGGLIEPGEFDCSSSTGAILYLGGLVDRDVLRGTFYTGNLVKKLVATGLFTAISVKGQSLAKIRAQLREGDALLGPGHVVYSLGGGKIVSFETDERGRSSGGKKGDQTGREGRIRDLYARSRGWTYIVRPVTAAVLEGRILAAYSKGEPIGKTLEQLARRAPFDGPRWAWFMDAWQRWDRGMTLAYDPSALAVPSADHVFVVLGSTIAGMDRRLAVALPALQANPASRVLVTGGVQRGEISEAAYMRSWLIDHGVAVDRILTETRSASTIGNAKYSVPILLEAHCTRYTVVTDASHQRRAGVLFLAARLGIETSENRRLVLKSTTPLAVNDYAPDPVKTEGPASTATRREITKEVASLLGLAATN